MKEKKSRKEWIKTVAIIFLSVLLVLTFFSNTIKNYSLPEVAAQYSYQDTITNKVRGSGFVESTDPYNVVCKSARTIKSVKVRVGDEVSKDDVLFVLEDEESQELVDARKSLEKAEKEYELAVLKDMISQTVTANVENGNIGTLENNQSAIANAKASVDYYTKALEAAEEALKNYEEAPDSYVPEKEKKTQAEKDLAAWTTQDSINAGLLSDAEDAYKKDSVVKVILSDIETVEKEKADLPKDDPDYDEKIKDLNQTITDLNKALDKTDAKKDLDYARLSKNTSTTKINELTALVKTYENSEYELKLAVTKNQEALAKAEKNLETIVNNITTQYSLDSMLDSIREAENLVKSLEKAEGNHEITAPVSGTILSVNYVAGETISPDREVASIQIAGKGFTLSMTVPNEKAALLNLGDEAEVSNSWWYSDVHARVTAIKPNKDNPAKEKTVVFEIEGEVQNGQELTLSAGRRSASYDAVVPNSAIREDNKGKYVYIVNSKPTPLGTRYLIEKVAVTVIASDDNKSAVSGLESWVYVVTNSSKPIEDGTEVRLKD